MRKKLLVTTISSIFLSNAVLGQDAASIDVGGFDLIPTVAVDMTHDDNVTRSSDNAIESWKRTIVPELLLVNEFGLNLVQLGYRMTRGDYTSSSADNFTDHLLSADVALELDSRNRLSINALYNDGHDDRGTSFSIGNGESLSSPDTFKNSSVNATYSYGALTSKGRIDITAGYAVTDYDIDTDAYRSRDRDTLNTGTTFYYQIMPATDLTFDLIYNDISYDFALDADAPLDSKEKRALVGVEWESTAVTTGYAKIGYRNKDFSAAGRDSFNGLDWQVGVTWQPLTYSTVDFQAFTNTNETNGEGDFIKTNTFLTTWDHQWLERVSTTIRASYSTDTYTGGTDRKDDNTTIGLTFNYEMQRWLVIQLGYTFDQRDSNRDIIDFDRNLFSLTARVSL